MKTQIHLLLLAGSMLAVTLSPLRAQVVNDGATNTLSNVTNSITGDVTVGTNGSFTLLVLSDNALLTNSANGLIGRNATAKSNEVRLASASARWRMGGSLFVGSNGAMSRLVVSNGALVENNDGVLARTAASSNNFALITGGGSVWSNRNQLDIGGSGPDNRMVVSNGGWVASRTGVLGRDTSSRNNLVLVTGSGSVWSNALDLFVGNLLPGNRLIIEAGGLVSCDNGFIGVSANASASEALVTGPGSILSTRSFLTIGNSASFNRLVVSNGAAVRSFVGRMGSTSFAVGNQVVVTGAGSTWTNQETLLLGDGSTGNRTDVSDGGWLACNNGFVGGSSFGNNNTVVLTGPNSGWNNLANLIVGDDGSGNVLIASNGATVLSSNATIGAGMSFGNNNLALITGAGSVWSNRNDLKLGNFGVGNRLVVSNGASVFIGGNGAIGINIGAASNSIVLTDPGTRLLPGLNSDLIVGSNGAFNRLVISNGAVADCRIGDIGYNTTSGTNEAVITGPGSAWRTGLNTIVGRNGAGNRLTISNGGSVRSAIGVLGLSSGGSNNEAIVTGPGSAWTNRFDCYVGNLAPGNRLVITNGGLVVVSNNAILGVEISSTNNRLIVDGGILRAVNPVGNGTLDVRRGTNVLNAGLIEVDQLLLGNTAGRFEFNGGTLSVRKSTVSNGQLFRVGNGTSPATFNLAGNGLHDFSGTLAVSVSSNAIFTGNGTLKGGLVVLKGGILSPGASIGKLVLSNSPSLQGATIMEISKSGATLSNDQIQVLSPLTYGGSLSISHLGPTALAAGDSFQLFAASSYTGSFSNVSLPALDPGLGWNNKLLVDGSIEVTFGQVVLTNATVRVMASNLTSGNDQRYETPGLNILQGLKPDIVAIQEFNVSNSFGINTTAALSNMVATTFGPEFVFFRESGYAIPNGVISRYPILASDSWEDSDTGISDRGFAWAQIDLPGTNDLFVVSVHLKASSGASNEARRAAEAAELKDLITTNFPANAWIIVAGDMNLFSEDEQAIVTFRTFLSDSPVPADQNGDPDTNASRAERYDRVLPSFSMTNTLIPLVMPSRTYTNGLVFDSRVYTPLSEVAPVQTNDSAAFNMQHMAVVKVFNVPFTITNLFPPGDRFWTNGLGGNYDIAANWLDNLVPQSRDNARFTNNASYQVNWSSAALAANADFNAGGGTLTQAIGGVSWTLTNSYIVGRDVIATAAVTHVSGALRVTNSAGNARLVIGQAGRGTYHLSGGEVVADFLLATNGSNSIFNFIGGTLRTRNATVNNGLEFAVGTGASPATFELLGNSTHPFVNGLRIQPKGLLTGNGTVSANVIMAGSLSPGSPQGGIGQLKFNGGALNFLSGSTNLLELNKSAGTNDTIVSVNLINYAGTLVVTNLSGALANGDRFQLFTTPSYFGAFSSLILPALDPGLSWKNNTRLDGSLEVVTTPARDFGVDVSHFQGESGVSQASWNQMFAEGKRFVFIKATEGLTGPHDGAMSNNVARAMAAGLLAGVYHFAHPENRPTTNGAVLEASNMVVYAGSAIGPGRLRPVLDLERGANLTTSDLTDWVIAFSNEIIARRGPSAAPIIYCSQTFANSELDSRLANYDLWIRTVGSGVNPEADDPPAQSFFTDPTGVFNNWSFWQYSDTGSSGGISPLDLDVCHSEYKPLNSYLIPGAAPTTITLTGMTASMSGAFQINFTNTPGASFTILTTTNVSLPLAEWTVLGAVNEISPGQFQFTDSQATNHLQRYYLVRSP